MVESLIKGGAFDSFGKTRATLMASYERIMDAVATDRKNQVEGQLSLFDELIEDVTVKYTELPEYDLMHILAGEKEVLGMYVSGHPLDNYTDTLREFNFETSMLYTKEYDENGDEVAVLNRALTGRNVCMGCIVESHERKMTGKQQRFAVGRLEDREGSIEFSMYPRAYEKLRLSPRGGRPRQGLRQAGPQGRERAQDLPRAPRSVGKRRQKDAPTSPAPGSSTFWWRTPPSPR